MVITRCEQNCNKRHHSFDAFASAVAAAAWPAEAVDAPSCAFAPASSPGVDTNAEDDDADANPGADADADAAAAAAEAADSAAVTADSPNSGSSARASICSGRESGRHCTNAARNSLTASASARHGGGRSDDNDEEDDECGHVAVLPDAAEERRSYLVVCAIGV